MAMAGVLLVAIFIAGGASVSDAQFSSPGHRIAQRYLNRNGVSWEPMVARIARRWSNLSLRSAREYLVAHNRIRSRFGEAPLSWDPKLARIARRWSNNLRLNCEMVHSSGPYGENLFWGSGEDWKPADAVRYWAEEEVDYNWEKNECSPERICGHFTQIVWNGTERVGCGRAECLGGRGTVITCNYDPPGNWEGERPLP